MKQWDYMLICVDANTQFENLTPQQQAMIEDVLQAQWVEDIVPGTKVVNGKKLIAAVVPRDALVSQVSPQQLQQMLADPVVMKATIEGMAQQYGLDWQLMHFRTVEGVPKLDAQGKPVLEPEIFVPMDAVVKAYIQDTVDDQGNPVPPSFPYQLATFDIDGLKQFPVMVG